MTDPSGQPNDNDAIQRAEDVRPQVAASTSELREAIQQPVAASPGPTPADERTAADEGIPFQRERGTRSPIQRVNRTLFGQTIRERRGFMFGAAIWTLLGMGLVTVAVVTANIHVALAAVAPIAVALMLVLLRPRPFVCHIEEGTLKVDPLKLTLPIAAIEELIAGGSKKEAFLVCHANGFVSVPTSLNIPWQAFHEFLRDNLQPQLFTSRLPARLQKYFDRNVALFGPRDIHVFWARERLKPVNAGRTGLAMCAGLFLSGLVWFVIGVSMVNQRRGIEVWLAVGLAIAFASLILAPLIYGLARKRAPRLKNWQKSALVVGPAGLALEQGELVGELRWEEVRKIANLGKSASFTLDSRGTQPCIRLDVAGASIMVLDLYHRPLFHIHELIESLWHDAKR